MSIQSQIFNTGQMRPYRPASGTGISPPVDPPIDPTLPPPAGATPQYPWNMPPRSALTLKTNGTSGVPRFVMPHNFITFPPSFNNETVRPDYWDLNRIPPGSGTNAVYGGESRYRKFFAPHRNEANWQALNLVQEIQWAAEAGFDGFFVDMLQANRPTGDITRWVQVKQLMEACNIWNLNRPVNEKMWIVLMPDGTTSATSIGAENILADTISSVWTDPCLWKFPNGDLLIAPYQPEGDATHAGRAFWDAAAAALHARGVNFRIWNCYQKSWTAAPQAPAFNSMVDLYGNGRWGSRNPTSTANTGVDNRGAAAYNAANFPAHAPWLAPVSYQDVRPNQAGWTEAGGWDQLIQSWLSAIQTGTQSVQIPTWDDFAEMAAICPSIGGGFAILDVMSYYNVWYKMGVSPTIVRDGLYLAHRIHWCNSTPTTVGTGFTITGPQTRQSLRLGGDAFRNEIDLVAFLTGPGTLRITAGTAVTTRDYTAGGMQQLKAPLPQLGPGQTAQVKAELVRNGTVVQTITSPNLVRYEVVSEDFTYKYWGYGDQFNGTLFNRGSY